jgi:hypothetical protein
VGVACLINDICSGPSVEGFVRFDGTVNEVREDFDRIPFLFNANQNILDIILTHATSIPIFDFVGSSEYVV